jgi:hypothetical protein
MLGAQTAAAKKMYRWVDEQENVRFSDQVPPDQVKYRRESLSDRVRVLDVVEKEKTKAQRELEKRFLILRKQQEEIIAKQKSYDKVLLSTFRTVGDMELALKVKMLALDGKIKMFQGNLNRLEQQLQQLQKRAAQYERDGRKEPPGTLARIADFKEQISQADIDISMQMEKNRKVEEDFKVDISRFVFLTKSDAGSKFLSRKTAEKKTENELGLYICETEVLCDKAWLAAKRFVYTHSTTSLDIETDALIMSMAPYRDADLSISVSKMDVDKKRKQIFLDIRCHKSSLGAELCQGEKAKKIRYSFSDYIKSTLISENKTAD